jgi:hypothetical protein
MGPSYRSDYTLMTALRFSDMSCGVQRDMQLRTEGRMLPVIFDVERRLNCC